MTRIITAGDCVDGGRERRIAIYREKISQQLAFHKQRIDLGRDPRCGLRLMTPDSATVVPNGPFGCAIPFAQFSLDSRDSAIYAIAHQAAADLVEYAIAATSGEAR